MARRSEAILEQFVEYGSLTPCGADWLKKACDPYHDKEVRVEGYPDVYVGGSITQEFKLEMTVVAPSIVTGTATWDSLICNSPFLNGAALTSSTLVNGNAILTSSSSGQFTIGGLNAISGPTGSDLSGLTPLTSFSGSTLGLALDPSVFTRPYRVMYQGFEVTNTTSPLNVQGAVTVFRQPQPRNGAVTSYNLNTGTAVAPVYAPYGDVQYWLAPPNSVANAMLLLGSRTWKAADGAYVNLVQRDMDLGDPTSMPVNQMIVPAGFAPGTPPTIGLYQSGGPGSTAGTSFPFTATHSHNLGGAYFTGLSASTSLTVTWVVGIESFPTPADKNLVVMASPSPEYDPVALMLYSRALCRMPVGVMVKENGLGQWFADLVSELAPYASGALSAIPHPLAQGLSVAANIAGKAADRYRVAAGAVGDGLSKKKRSKRRTRGQAVAAAMISGRNQRKRKGPRPPSRAGRPPLPPARA